MHGVDIILFNPPYVPTSSDEAEDAQEARTIEGSWAGGFNGMELTNIFLKRVEVCTPSCIRRKETLSRKSI